MCRSLYLYPSPSYAFPRRNTSLRGSIGFFVLQSLTDYELHHVAPSPALAFSASLTRRAPGLHAFSVRPRLMLSIEHGTNVMRNVGGAAGNEGLGAFSLCLDWAYVGAGGGTIGSLFTPLATQLSLYSGTAVCM